MRMANLATALMAILCSATAGTAQPQPAPGMVTIVSRGASARTALESLAHSLNYTLKLDPAFSLEEDFENHVWLRLKDSEPARAARLVSIATGKFVRLDEAHRLVIVSESSESAPRRAVIRGHDVSVATGRFVAYVNQYGAPAAKPAADSAPARETSPAARLAALLSTVLADDDVGPEFAVVGDRLLLRDEEATHARVRECLELLSNDGGGASASSKSEGAMREALSRAKPPLALEETPRASALAQLCEVAGVDFVLRHDVVEVCEDEHVSITLPQDASVLDALDEIFPQMFGGWMLAYSTVAVGMDYYTTPGYRVFETGELLRKLDAAYQRQQTQDGKANGFTGGLRAEGGMSVVSDALIRMLAEHAAYVMLQHWGTRVIVRGSPQVISQAESALKEMGWEPPK